MNIVVVGAGAWGTALAVHAAKLGRHAVTLWSRDPAQAVLMQKEQCNRRYLPDVQLPSGLQISHANAAVACTQADLLVLATPSAALTEWLQTIDAVDPSERSVVWLSKGFIKGPAGQDSCLAHEVASRVAPRLLTGILSGPSFAQEVAAGLPTALVACSPHLEVRQKLIDGFHGANLRVYANDDVVGVEVGGAVKNVLAIATGLCDGMALGLNARAALITRGLAEMSRLGVALGARPETFMGLSGLGDLVLTATGDLSRNRQVGLQLATGRTLQQAVEGLGHVAEGVRSAPIVLARARDAGIEMPITEAVVQLLAGELSPEAAIARLMGRQARPE